MPNGVIQSTEHHTLTETSTVAHFCEPVGLSTRFLYHSPRLWSPIRWRRIHHPTPCFMRGPGEAPGLFALEVAMDELAYAAASTLLELRVRNDVPLDQASGRDMVFQALAGMLRQGAERFSWDLRTMLRGQCCGKVYRWDGVFPRRPIRDAACRQAAVLRRVGMGPLNLLLRPMKLEMASVP